LACGQSPAVVIIAVDGHLSLSLLGPLQITLDGDPAQAAAYFLESLYINMQVKDPRGMTASIAGLGAVAVVQQQWTRAARLFGAVESILATLGAPLLPVDRRQTDRQIATLRASLPPGELAAAWAGGQALTLEQAIAEVRKDES
jgi:non-specific serine/threonine protein kinase